jgi:hypothetical protein
MKALREEKYEIIEKLENLKAKIQVKIQEIREKLKKGLRRDEK